MKPLQLLQRIAQIIADKKGFNTLVLDVTGFSSISDFLFIAEGNVDRHLIAIAKAIMEELGKEGIEPLYVEGLQTGDWIAIDYGEVMIHLFAPGFRERYALERLWKESQIVELCPCV
ncbi:MAG: ribosome silencing factor [Verrucomicrobiota bacterium]|nr:ribosome silencing factor [Verrucomicrobiota bacterium]